MPVQSIRVLTNHPRKVIALEAYGPEIVDQIPLTGKTAKTIYQAL